MATRRSRSDSDKRKRSRVIHRGEEGRDRVDQELEKQKRRREEAANKVWQPLRFFVPVGDTKEIVILDDKPEIFLYEHTTKNPRDGKWNVNIPCISDWAHCPVCDEYGEPTYVMFLSVLDFTTFKDKSGKTHKFSRKLMGVKPAQQKKFMRKYEKEGSLRGAIFECTRDGPKDAAIGNDIEFIEWMDEDELSNDYIKKFKDRDNKDKSENCGEVYDYDAIFEEPSEEELLVAMGRGPQPGSRRESKKEFDEEHGSPWEDDDADQGKWEDEPSRSTRSSRRRGKQDDDESTSRRSSRRRGSDREEEVEEEEERPSRRRGRKSSDSDDDDSRTARRPPRRSRRGQEEEVEEEEETSTRRSSRSSRRGSRR